ncbi:hypothetical protein BDW59DRAFT_153237 [Aspergillus cavernicola]|uniref:Uncharacterized protein n=1 Tax=Aspergillus cavernicola TaxID=176166 RepID=A0ABR4HLT3_9EURO
MCTEITQCSILPITGTRSCFSPLVIHRICNAPAEQIPQNCRLFARTLVGVDILLFGGQLLHLSFGKDQERHTIQMLDSQIPKLPSFLAHWRGAKTLLVDGIYKGRICSGSTHLVLGHSHGGAEEGKSGDPSELHCYGDSKIEGSVEELSGGRRSADG